MGAGSDILKAIAQFRAEIRADVAQLRADVLALHSAAPTNGHSSAPAVASDADLDDPQWGDKEIRVDPPRWKGEHHKGERWSACPADYLDALAAFLDWTASDKRKKAESLTGDEREKQLKYAGYDTLDAAKVRGHAQRKRCAPSVVDEL